MNVVGVIASASLIWVQWVLDEVIFQGLCLCLGWVFYKAKGECSQRASGGRSSR